ncbi:hypothetical protein BX589_1024 [Paraburkholderia fungorum]|nr:hypothetical protein BX589_1024 [Paraburkholderia fungorum]
MNALSLKLRAVEQFPDSICPHCAAPSEMQMFDGDTGIDNLFSRLTEAQKSPTAYFFEWTRWGCKECRGSAIAFELMFMNRPESSDVIALLLGNDEGGPAIKYLGEAPHFPIAPWEIIEYQTPHGLMHHHWFGFFKQQVNIGKYGADLLLSLWDDLRDLNRQPISVLWEHAELQSVIQNPHAIASAPPPLEKSLVRPRLFNPFRRVDSKSQAPF